MHGNEHDDGTICAEIASAAGVTLATIGTDGRVLSWHGDGSLLSLTEPTAPASNWPLLFDPERTEQLWTALQDDDQHRFRQQLRSFDGSRWVEIIGSRLPDRPDRFACVVLDATDSVRDATSMKRVENVLHGTSDFVTTWDPKDGRITWSNDPATVILGLAPGSGRTVRDVVPDDQLLAYHQGLGVIDESGNWAGTLDLEPAPGYRIPCKVNLIRGRDPETDRPSISMVGTEISDLRAAEDRLNWAAEHDQLTGLANRTRLTRQLDETLERVVTTEELAGILYCDLDGFKAVNDEHGHAAGDAVLVAVSERITSTLRDHDLACRFGGDEFVVLVTKLNEPELVDRIADRIEHIVGQPIAIEGSTVSVGISIGAVVLDGSTLDADAALQRADQFMYA
ncbi:MAG: diguanylate cyclase, partial [Actinomycetota bacterium]